MPVTVGSDNLLAMQDVKERGEPAAHIDLGSGVYSFADAARIIARSAGRMSSRQLHYWAAQGLCGSQAVVGEEILNFQDLVSLEMVSRFRGQGVSLQAVRVAHRRLQARHPEHSHPLAASVFYTDGERLWAADAGEVIEIVGKVDQLAWRDIVGSFASEITLENGVATRWRPTQWVELNPRVQFGAPVVADTRVTVDTLVANLEVGTPEEVAEWYGLSAEQVRGAGAYFYADAA